MKQVILVLAVTAISVLIALAVRGKAGPSAENAVSLCGTYGGPAFINPDGFRNAVAIHAGQSPRIFFVALDTGQIEESLAVPQRFLASSLAPDNRFLKFAVKDTSGISIRSYDILGRKETSSGSIGMQTGELAAFTPDGTNLLGVTTAGNVFKFDIQSNKLETLEGAAVAAQAIAISPDNNRLYVVGRGIAVIDIQHLRVLSVLTQETLLIGIAVSPDGSMLAVRNWHSLVLLNSANGSKISDSVIVDAKPNAISQSMVNIVFSPDGSQLFYAGTSYVESELIAFSLPDLSIAKRVKLGPIASAIAVVPSRRWVLLTTGAPRKEQLQAFDMKTLAVQFQTALVERATRNTDSQHTGCVDSSRSSVNVAPGTERDKLRARRRNSLI